MIEEIKVDGLDELLDAIKEGAGGVPEPLPAEKGMYLHSNSSTGDIEWATIPSQLPGYGAQDAGKALKVNSEGTDVEWGTVSSGEVYSTSEAVVGTWTDGRPVYQKVYTATMTGNTSSGIQHGLYGIADQIVDVSGIVKAGTAYYKLGDLRTVADGQVSNALGVSSIMLQDLGSIGIFAGKAYSGWSLTFNVYLRYTKSADLQS